MDSLHYFRYVTALEDRIERFERLFKRVCHASYLQSKYKFINIISKLRPEADFISILGPPLERDSWRGGLAYSRQSTSRTPQPDSSQTVKSSPASKAFFTIRGSPAAESDLSEASDEEYGYAHVLSVRLPISGPSIQNATKQRQMEEHGLTEVCSRSIRYVGKSSPANLVRATREQRRGAIGDDGFYDLSKDEDAPLADFFRIGIPDMPRSRRRMYWSLQPVGPVIPNAG